MLSALVNAQILSTHVETFSTSYAVHYSCMSPGRNNVPLNFFRDRDILLRLAPRYEFKCPASEHNTLVLNTLINDQWQNEERPQGFPFFANEFTSIIVTPQKSAYHIFAQAADTIFTYDFSYRHGHNPSEITRITAESFDSACPPVLPYKPYALSIGYHIPIYSIGTEVHVHATAPVTGDMAIDIILGIPEDKEDLPVALKVKLYFNHSPSIMLLSDANGVLVGERILCNPILPDSSFVFNIKLQDDGYKLTVDGNNFATFSHIIPLPTTPGPATVWVTGATTLDLY